MECLVRSSPYVQSIIEHMQELIKAETRRHEEAVALELQHHEDRLNQLTAMQSEEVSLIKFSTVVDACLDVETHRLQSISQAAETMGTDFLLFHHSFCCDFDRPRYMQGVACDGHITILSTHFGYSLIIVFSSI